MSCYPMVGGGEMREDVGEEECDGRRMITSLTWAKESSYLSHASNRVDAITL